MRPNGAQSNGGRIGISAQEFSGLDAEEGMSEQGSGGCDSVRGCLMRQALKLRLVAPIVPLGSPRCMSLAWLHDPVLASRPDVTICPDALRSDAL